MKNLLFGGGKSSYGNVSAKMVDPDFKSDLDDRISDGRITSQQADDFSLKVAKNRMPILKKGIAKKAVENAGDVGVKIQRNNVAPEMRGFGVNITPNLALTEKEFNQKTKSLIKILIVFYY